MHRFTEKLNELLELAEQTDDFYETEISFSIRLREGNESYFVRLTSDSDSKQNSRTQPNADQAQYNSWF